MKKTYKTALVSALTLFTLSATPLVSNDHLNVAQAATTKKTHYKKARHTKELHNYLKVPANYPIKFINGKYHVGKFPHYKPINSAYKINHFHFTKHDRNIHIHYEHLTYKQQKYLSQYAANIINNVRRQITHNHPTTADLTVNPTALNFAREIVKGYNHDKWDSYKYDSKDYDRINNAANKFGLDDNEFYEIVSPAGIYEKIHNPRLSTVKHVIYSEIKDDFFHDFSNSHSKFYDAFKLTQLNMPRQKTNFFALDFDNLGQIHFEIIPYDYILKNEQNKKHNYTSVKEAEKDSELDYQDIEQAKEQARDMYEDQADQEIANDEQNSIQSHISTNQPFDKQFAKFKSILINNELNKLESEGKHGDLEETSNYKSKKVTITDANYPKGKKFKFNPNIILTNKSFNS